MAGTLVWHTSSTIRMIIIYAGIAMVELPYEGSSESRIEKQYNSFDDYLEREGYKKEQDTEFYDAEQIIQLDPINGAS